MSEFQIDSQKLLSDKRVIEEIHRHLWIESEKAGYDIGFENAKEDWLIRFAPAWMEYHMPEEYQKAKRAGAANKISSHKSSIASAAIQELSKKFKAFNESAASKRRRAKSYF